MKMTRFYDDFRPQKLDFVPKKLQKHLIYHWQGMTVLQYGHRLCEVMPRYNKSARWFCLANPGIFIKRGGKCEKWN